MKWYLHLECLTAGTMHWRYSGPCLPLYPAGQPEEYLGRKRDRFQSNTGVDASQDVSNLVRGVCWPSLHDRVIMRTGEIIRRGTQCSIKQVRRVQALHRRVCKLKPTHPVIGSSMTCNRNGLLYLGVRLLMDAKSNAGATHARVGTSSNASAPGWLSGHYVGAHAVPNWHWCCFGP